MSLRHRLMGHPGPVRSQLRGISFQQLLDKVPLVPPIEQLQQTTLSHSRPGQDFCTRVVNLVSVAALEHRVSILLVLKELFCQMRVAHTGTNAVFGVEDVIPHLPHRLKQSPALPHRDG